VLEGAGLLARARDGRVHRCHLAPEAMREAADWIERYRRFRETRHASLARYLEDPNADTYEPKERPDAPDRHER
jgi:hypothetical protein